MYTGQGILSPYGWSSTGSLLTVRQGYFALIDQVGVPYWIFSIRDVFNTNPTSNVCTYIRHQQIATVDYAFVMCNVIRFDRTTYTEAPMLIKMKYTNAEVVFMKYLPIDPNSNTMS